METLDKCFENVCELDLIFHMDKVGNALYYNDDNNSSYNDCYYDTATAVINGDYYCYG